MGRIKETLAAYLAGHFDGEGTIYINSVNRVKLQITHTHYATMLIYKSTFGGYLYSVKARKAHYKPLWRWALQDRVDVFQCLLILEPYLFEKKELAQRGLSILRVVLLAELQEHAGGEYVTFLET